MCKVEHFNCPRDECGKKELIIITYCRAVKMYPYNNIPRELFEERRFGEANKKWLFNPIPGCQRVKFMPPVIKHICEK